MEREQLVAGLGGRPGRGAVRCVAGDDHAAGAAEAGEALDRLGVHDCEVLTDEAPLDSELPDDEEDDSSLEDPVLPCPSCRNSEELDSLEDPLLLDPEALDSEELDSLR